MQNVKFLLSSTDARSAGARIKIIPSPAGYALVAEFRPKLA